MPKVKKMTPTPEDPPAPVPADPIVARAPRGAPACLEPATATLVVTASKASGCKVVLAFDGSGEDKCSISVDAALGVRVHGLIERSAERRWDPVKNEAGDHLVPVAELLEAVAAREARIAELDAQAVAAAAFIEWARTRLRTLEGVIVEAAIREHSKGRSERW